MPQGTHLVMRHVQLIEALLACMKEVLIKGSLSLKYTYFAGKM